MNSRTGSRLSHRLATPGDQEALGALMEAAIAELQKPFLSAAQIAASRTFMGIDTQLIVDRTYFVVESGGELAGCGGWSRRATLYGGDRTPGRNAALLDPRSDAARVRAMYTHPAHTRQGVGRLILRLCEQAAAAEGFRRVELMSTMSGVPLYTACGYESAERIEDARGGVPVPLIRMYKAIAPIRLVDARSDEHWRQARAFVEEYAGALAVDLSFQDIERELEHLREEYSPPSGAFFLAEVGGDFVGCIGLRRFADGVGEIKRLYVGPSARGHGIGRRLVDAAVAAARDCGYARVVLDTLPSMQDALRLYASLGFTPTAPYRFNPIEATSYLEKIIR
jgi:GNAT superfamily N-acetyltransferase